MKSVTLAAVIILSSVPGPVRAEGVYEPDVPRIRAALTARPTGFPLPDDPARPAPRERQPTATIRSTRDSVWNGVLIGAAIGAGGGYLWAKGQCGSNDDECFSIARPAGVLGGAAIGAAVGALLDALSN